MRIIYKVSDRVTLEVDATSRADAFTKLAGLDEVFAETTCGKCGGKEVAFRQIKEYRKFKCCNKACNAELSVMTRKEDGSLFISRTNADKTPKENNGWTVWGGEAKKPDDQLHVDGGGDLGVPF